VRRSWRSRSSSTRTPSSRPSRGDTAVLWTVASEDDQVPGRAEWGPEGPAQARRKGSARRGRHVAAVSSGGRRSCCISIR
jgi:hypothetical protein